MADPEAVPIIGPRSRACGGIGRRARLRALSRVCGVRVRVSLGALIEVGCGAHVFGPSEGQRAWGAAGERISRFAPSPSRATLSGRNGNAMATDEHGVRLRRQLLR